MLFAIEAGDLLDLVKLHYDARNLPDVEPDIHSNSRSHRNHLHHKAYDRSDKAVNLHSYDRNLNRRLDKDNHTENRRCHLRNNYQDVR